jgi:molecular chaperone HtpG
MHKEDLQDLLMFYSSIEKKMVTLDEYVQRMKEDQKYIYYAAGESVERIEKLPQTELISDKGYEILYFTEDIDEFAIKMMMDYKEKQFKSVSEGDLGIDDEEEKETEQEKSDDKALLAFMKEELKDKVEDVRISKRLKNHPVCLSSEGPVSIEMEKVLNTMPNNQAVAAQKVLEVNRNSIIYETLKNAFDTDKEKLRLYTKLLYDQALLLEGLSIENPLEFSTNICKLMK